eukprot:maker-scaffold15_size728074-snap-gene-1.12 protein:Tk08842 transcript:maker-scaffold15_size728074-snap-gene-1.12-mRNA-1 annotation:"hypothetical protein PPL_07323"
MMNKAKSVAPEMEILRQRMVHRIEAGDRISDIARTFGVTRATSYNAKRIHEAIGDFCQRILYGEPHKSTADMIQKVELDPIWIDGTLGTTGYLKIKMTDLQREESFKTALKNQKRRLSATKMPSKALLVQEPPTSCQTAPSLKNVKINGHKPQRKSSIKEESLFSLSFDNDGGASSSQGGSSLSSRSSSIDEEEPITPPSPVVASPPAKVPAPQILQAPNSPYTPRTPSPLVQCGATDMNLASKTPLLVSRGRSPNLKLNCKSRDNSKGRSAPLPPDSPLLCRTPPSPMALKARELKRELRRARSFHRSLERSREGSCSRYESDDEASDGSQPPAMRTKPEEVSFSIRKNSGNRKGWKIMPEVGQIIKPEALKKVVAMIKDMEVKGHDIPERISITL